MLLRDCGGMVKPGPPLVWASEIQLLVSPLVLTASGSTGKHDIFVFLGPPYLGALLFPFPSSREAPEETVSC